MAYWDNETEVGTVPKNKAETQRFSHAELKGKKYISITNLKLINGETIPKPIGGTSIVITDELRAIWPALTAIVMNQPEEIKEQV